jgi:hypothetical protein
VSFVYFLSFEILWGTNGSTRATPGASTVYMCKTYFGKATSGYDFTSLLTFLLFTNLTIEQRFHSRFLQELSPIALAGEIALQITAGNFGYNKIAIDD